MTLEERVDSIFRETLDLGPEADLGTISYNAHPNWDSVGQMALIIAIEDEFGLELDTESAQAIDSFGATVKVLRELGAEG
jgi:acyl carrier protein